MKFQDEYKNRQSEFQILAFHDAKASDVADLERKIKPLIDEVWGRDLPFPVLLDKTGETVRSFGIRSFPTTVLIDPKGKVVKHGGVGTVKNHLLETSSGVKGMLRQLKGARDDETFKAAVAAVTKEGGPSADFALVKFTEKATPAQIDSIFFALAESGGAYAVGFFLGPHGLKAKDKARRIAAAEALGEHAERGYLWTLSDMTNAEKDPDVKRALSAALEKINSRR